MFISDSIKTDVVTITPTIAEKLLSRNTHNRNVSRTNYNKVREAMVAGEWELNGEAIKVATNGRILDGQHRLLVSAENNLTFTTLIVYGLPSEIQDTMDTGKARSIGDVLRLNGINAANETAGIATALVRLEKYGIRAALHGTSGGGREGYSVTSRQVLDRCIAEPSITELISIVRNVRKLGTGAVVPGMLYYIFSGIDVDDTEYFFEKLASGEGLESGSPILALRNALISMAGERGAKNRHYLAAIFIKAWNKYRVGEPIFQLKFRSGGAKPESFPEPK